MELSAESVYLSTHTAPPRPLIIPDIPAWSDPEAAAVAAALQAPVAAAAAQLLQDGVTSMVKVLDECRAERGAGLRDQQGAGGVVKLSQGPRER